MATTHRDLEEMVRQETLRTDLFVRLKGVVTRIPALRDRPRDVDLLDDGTEIDVDDFGLGPLRTGASLAEHLEPEERNRVIGILQSVRWNQSAAARILKIKRTTLIGR